MGDRTEILDVIDTRSDDLLDELNTLNTRIPMLQETRDVHAMNTVYFLRSREPAALELARAEAERAHQIDVEIQNLLRGEDH